MSSDISNLLKGALHEIKAFEADIIYLYSDLRYFGKFSSSYSSKQAFCNAFLSPFLLCDKTIIMPTFTYTTQGQFDVLETPTRLGALNKWMLTQTNVKRSEHPLFSYAAIGPQADLIQNIGKSAFGHDSVYERLRNKRTAFLHIGRPVSYGNTSLHHIEHNGGATYRIHKCFKTKSYRGRDYCGTNYSAFLRRLDVPGERFGADFTSAAAKLKQNGLIRQVGKDENLSNVSFYWYDSCLDFMHSMFRKDPSIFIGSNFIGY